VTLFTSAYTKVYNRFQLVIEETPLIVPIMIASGFGLCVWFQNRRRSVQALPLDKSVRIATTTAGIGFERRVDRSYAPTAD
jgi:hypothetical protein